MFIELPSFRPRWKNPGLRDDDLKRLEQENLSKAERNDLKKLVEFLELELERKDLK